MKIRDSRLYRETHDTFEDYCRDRWEMSMRHAERLMLSAGTVETLRPMGRVPVNERQARPLTKLGTKQLQREAWQRVVETAPDGKVKVKVGESVGRQITSKG